MNAYKNQITASQQNKEDRSNLRLKNNIQQIKSPS